MKILVEATSVLLENDTRFLIPYMEQDHEIHYGFVDHKGSIIIPAKYDKIFNDFLAKDDFVRVGYRYVVNYGTLEKPRIYNYYHCGIIDSLGKEIIPPLYDEIYFGNSKKAFVVRKDRKYGVIDVQNKLIVPFGLYAWISPGFYRGFARVLVHREGRGDVWGVINELGEVVVPVECAHIKFTRDTRGDKLYYKIDGVLHSIDYLEPICTEVSNRRDAYGELYMINAQSLQIVDE